MHHKKKLTWQEADRLIATHTEEVRSDQLCTEPLLSVCLLTYNHQKFIHEAFESVLAQSTQFPIEVVIGDDCSTDGTTEIVKDYQRRYPERVRVLLAKENLGQHTGNGRLNFIRLLRACRGQYIALLEGDDYWTDPNKLRKQIDILESRADVASVGHRVERVDERPGSLSRHVFPAIAAGDFGLTDILRDNFLPTCSVIFRRAVVASLPEWFLSVRVGDWPIHALCTRMGKLTLLNDTMAVHRIHSGGIWSALSRPQYLAGEILILQTFRRHIEGIEDTASWQIARRHFLRTSAFSQARERVAAIRSLVAGFYWAPVKDLLDNDEGSLAWESVSPRLYRKLRSLIKFFVLLQRHASPNDSSK